MTKDETDLSPHYATYACFTDDKTNRRITEYCYTMQDCYDKKDKPFFRWRNKGCHSEYKNWLKKQMEVTK